MEGSIQLTKKEIQALLLEQGYSRIYRKGKMTPEGLDRTKPFVCMSRIGKFYYVSPKAAHGVDSWLVERLSFFNGKVANELYTIHRRRLFRKSAVIYYQQ